MYVTGDDYRRARLESLLEGEKMPVEHTRVLKIILAEAYGRNGAPLGVAGAVPANRIGEEIYHYFYEETADEERWKKQFESVKRKLRTIINDLILHYRIPICCQAGPGGGYYLPATDEEVEANNKRFHDRAMTGLMKATRARRAAYAEAVVQLTLGFDTPEGEALRQRLNLRSYDSGPPPWMRVVTQLLDRCKDDPRQYAAEIRQIQERYRGLFVIREEVAEAKRQAERLAEQLRALAG